MGWFASLFKSNPAPEKATKTSAVVKGFEVLRGNGLAIIDAMAEVPAPFQKFVGSQPEEMRAGLTDMLEAWRSNVSTMQTLFTDIGAFGDDLMGLKALDQADEDSRRNMMFLRGAAESATANAKRSDEALAKAGKEGKPDEVARLQQRCSELHAVRQQAQQRGIECEMQHNKAHEAYIQSVLSRIGAFLEGASDLKMAELELLLSTADKFVVELVECEDPVRKKLLDDVAKLEAATAAHNAGEV